MNQIAFAAIAFLVFLIAAIGVSAYGLWRMGPPKDLE